MTEIVNLKPEQTGYDNPFMDNEEKGLPKIQDIPLSMIDDAPYHTFQVRLDEDMERLVDSIRERGVIVPVILREKKDGRYELVSGHRRKKACEILGLSTLKAEIKNLTRDEAIILMVDSNLQRSTILPSEKAFSYKAKLDAMKRQGMRRDLTCAPVEHKSVGMKSRDVIAFQTGESREQIRRYIRLTQLIPQLLKMVDNEKIALRPAVEISYLKKEEQEALYNAITYADATPSHAQTIIMRKYSKEGTLSSEVIKVMLNEEKPNQRERFCFRADRLRKFIPDNVPYEKAEAYVMMALDYYQHHLEQMKECDR